MVNPFAFAMHRVVRVSGACVLVALLLSSCSRETVPEKLSGATMGTTWHLSYLAPPPGLSPEELQQGISAQFERVNQSMSTYISESEISQLNAVSQHTWFKTSPELFHVLTAALDVGLRSQGAFDVTVAPLVELWGFGASGAITRPPGEGEIKAARARVGQQHLNLDSTTQSVMKKTDLALDVSSLAEGYAVDQVAEWLLEKGVDRFMLELGGELRLAGLSGRNDPWRIAIEQPDNTGRAVAATLQLTDMAVSTSGDYRNYFESDGRRYSHLIDPSTGYPVSHDLVSVTVVHPDCMLADAWSTALLVLGTEKAMSVAQAQGLAVYFIRRVDDGFVHSHTPLFAPYLVEAAR